MLYALYPQNNQSHSEIPAIPSYSCLLPLQKWTVVSTLFLLWGELRGALLMLKLHFLMLHSL